MRYINYLIALSIIWLSALESYAQCENGTTTNPSAPLPANAGFKTNTFDWRQNPIPLTKDFINGSIPNPFFSVGKYLEVLQGGSESDSKPSNGWELIKQDFGYAYANNNWQGSTIFNSTGAHQSGRAYMLLYNRYSGVLRIVGLLAGLSQYDQIVVILSQKPAVSGNSNQNEFKFSALFNNYNRQESSLEEKTKVSIVTAPAQVPGSSAQFFYADFKLSYDPCICFFKSALEVSFRIKKTSTLQLTGRILGQSVDIAQKNALPAPNYLTSVWNQNLPDQPYNQLYSSFAKLQEDIRNSSQESEDILLSVFNILKQGAKIAKGYNPAIGAFGSAFKGLKINELDSIGKLTGFFDFLSLFMGTDEKPSNPSVITAELAAIGRIEDSVIVNGAEFLVATPGSKDANLLPEYPTSPIQGQGLKPTYPMYNEIPGRFAVVKTPEILFNIVLRPYHATFKLKELSYAFNPIVDVAGTRAFVALETVYHPNGPVVQSRISKFFPIENARELFLQSFIAFDNAAGSPQNLIPENVNLIFQIYYQFKPDANGEIKVGQDFIKVKPKLTYTATRLSDDFRALILSTTETNLQISGQTFNAGQSIYSFGSIRITGNLTNNSSNPVFITAQDELIIEPNVTITGNIQFKSGQPLPHGFPVEPAIPPMTTSEIQTFCTSSEYKADEPLPLTAPPGIVQDPEITPQFKGKSYSLLVSPNPVTDQMTVDFNLDEDKEATILLYNTLGQAVKTVKLGLRNKGVYQEIIETNELSAGIYFLSFETASGKEVKKIVKQN